MAVNCDPNSLMQAAACFACVPEGEQMKVAIYLATQIAGVSADPAALLTGATCFNCIPAGYQLPVAIYLACQIANR